MRISAHSRRRFHDLCASDGTIRRMADVFEAEGVMPLEGYTGSETGERRWEAASHEASLDLSRDEDNARLLRVYVEAVAEFGRSFDGELSQTAKGLVQALIRDGAPLDADGNLTAQLPEPVTVSLDLADHTRLSRPRSSART